MLIVILSSSISFVFLCFLVAGWALFVKSNKTDYSSESGTMIFKLDLVSKKIFYYPYRLNKVRNHYLFPSSKRGQWVSIEFLSDSFIGTNGEKLFSEAIRNAAKSGESQFISFTLPYGKKKIKEYLISISIDKFEETDAFSMSISWKGNKEGGKEGQTYFLPLTKRDVVDANYNYKIFFSFNLNPDINDVQQKFLSEIKKIIKDNNFEYLFLDGVFIIPFFTNSLKKAKAIKSKYIALLEDRGKKNGIGHLFSGTSVNIFGGVESIEQIRTSKSFSKVLQIIDFCINLSIRTGKNYISAEDKEFNKDEFKNFSQSLITFREAIKNKEIDTVSIPIKKRLSNRTILSYALPTAKNISSNDLTTILRNQHNRKSLINCHSEIIAFNRTIEEPILVDINNEWLIDNHQKIFLKDAVYILNFSGYYEKDSTNVVSEMKKRGFLFALRIKYFNEYKMTIIKTLKPQFIIVDQLLCGDTESENYVQLMQIKWLSKTENIRVIYENPSTDIDEDMAQRIGINYLYRF